MTELLSPAGSPEAVIAAVQNGADAVYLGLGDFNARRGAKNFTEEEFEKAMRYCRIRGCRVYVTLNTLVDDRETEAAVAQARLVSSLGADGLIVQDLGLVRALRAALPDIPLHASTQMSIHNLAGVEAAAELGLTRAVLARELSIDQIRYITSHALRPRRAVLLPQRAVLYVRADRPQERQPRHVRPALPHGLFPRRTDGRLSPFP